MSDANIGTREYGKYNRRERWYACDVLGEVVPESDTSIPVEPHPQAGLRVCSRCLDPIDYNTRVRIAPPRISSTENEP